MKKNKLLMFVFLLVTVFVFNINGVFAKECENNLTKNDEYNFCSPNGLAYLSCGESYDIPPIIPKIVSYAITLLKTVTPVVLIIVSIITLVKSITAGKEDEIKKAQNSLIKRIIMAVFVFFTVSIVQFIMLKAAGSAEKKNLSSCLSCFLNGTSDCGNIYYKDGRGKCIYLDGTIRACN